MRAPARVLALAASLGLSLAGTATAQQRVARPLTLDECLRIAVAENLRVAEAGLRADEAAGAVVETRAASYPSLDVTGGYLRIQDVPTLGIGGTRVELGRPDAFFVDLGLDYTVYSGGAVDSAIRAAEGERRARGELRQATLEDMALRVREAFADVLLARELVGVRTASLEVLEAHLAETRRRYEQEAVSEFEVLRAEVEVAHHRPLLVTARERLAGARDLLTRRLGLDLESPVDVTGRLDAESPTIDVEAAVERALDSRDEIRAALARREAAAAALRVAEAGDRPQVVLFAHLLGTSPEYFLADDRSPAVDWIGGGMVRFSVFDGYRTRGRVQQERARLRGAEIAGRDARDAVTLDVRQAHRRLREAEAVVEATTPAIGLAERALAIARIRYDSGRGTQLEVTDAQLALSRARVVRLQAMRDRFVAAAALRRAMGESLLPSGGSR